MTATREADDAAALALFRAIVAGDSVAAARLLAESVALARHAIVVGASRSSTKPYFFERIAHYVYAGDTALHVAAAAYQVAIAEQLVSSGATPSARNRRGAEPLHYACDGVPGSEGWNPAAQYAMVQLLVRAGANPNALDKSGVAPLHRAVRTRSTAAVRALLQHGADPLRKNKSGSTPLHLAIQDTGRGSSGSGESRNEQREIIQVLLQHGARASDKNAAGKSVMDCVQADWIRAVLTSSLMPP